MQTFSRTFSRTLLLVSLVCVSFSAHAYEVGKPFQGGTIFWVDSQNRHGLIGAPIDSNGTFTWTNDYKFTGATSIDMYGGKANTDRILYYSDMGQTYAALKASHNSSGNYHDWYLPNVAELEVMISTGAMDGLEQACYWSSNEADKYTAYAVYYPSSNSNIVRFDKHDECKVRAIRRF